MRATIVAIGLIVVVCVFALWESTHLSATFDEPIHLAGGFIHWKLGQARIHTENGYLAQAIEAFPLLFTGTHLPDTGSVYFQHSDPFVLGYLFFCRSGNDPGLMLLLGRSAVGVLTAGAGLVVFLWAKRLFSTAGGFLALLLFLLSPLVLAHGFLATSDMAAAAFFLFATAAAWHALQRVTVTRVLVAGLTLGALALAKMSAPVILPVLGLCVAARVFYESPVEIAVWRRAVGVVHGRVGKAGVLMGAVVVELLIAWVLIWGAYGFRFSAGTTAELHFFPEGGWGWALRDPSVLHTAIGFARDHHLLPEAYLYGYAYVSNAANNFTYLNGGFTHFSWWDLPYIFLITTPFPILLLGLSGLALAYLFYKRRPPAGKRRWQVAAAGVYPAFPLVALLVCYWLVAMVTARSTAPRHLLPLYGPMCILLAFNVHLPLLISRKAALVALGAAPVWLGVASVSVAPDFLSYFNPIVGNGPEAFRVNDDSSPDWGQDLPALKKRLEELHPPGAVYLLYFGTVSPRTYGVDARLLPSYYLPLEQDPVADALPLSPGLYCVSTGVFAGALRSFNGPYTAAREEAYQATLKTLHALAPRIKDGDVSAEERERYARALADFPLLRTARLAAYLRDQQPVGRAGLSINLYEVTAADLGEALSGPAAVVPAP